MGRRGTHDSEIWFEARNQMLDVWSMSLWARVHYVHDQNSNSYIAHIPYSNWLALTESFNYEAINL